MCKLSIILIILFALFKLGGLNFSINQKTKDETERVKKLINKYKKK